MTRALIVEDERPLLRALAMNLSARDYTVAEANSGTKALVAIATSAFDVILLDLGLPDVSGLDVIRAVRQHSLTPIIVLSARTGSVASARIQPAPGSTSTMTKRTAPPATSYACQSPCSNRTGAPPSGSTPPHCGAPGHPTCGIPL